MIREEAVRPLRIVRHRPPLSPLSRKPSALAIEDESCLVSYIYIIQTFAVHLVRLVALFFMSLTCDLHAFYWECGWSMRETGSLNAQAADVHNIATIACGVFVQRHSRDVALYQSCCCHRRAGTVADGSGQCCC